MRLGCIQGSGLMRQEHLTEDSELSKLGSTALWGVPAVDLAWRRWRPGPLAGEHQPPRADGSHTAESPARERDCRAVAQSQSGVTAKHLGLTCGKNQLGNVPGLSWCPGCIKNDE